MFCLIVGVSLMVLRRRSSRQNHRELVSVAPRAALTLLDLVACAAFIRSIRPFTWLFTATSFTGPIVMASGFPNTATGTAFIGRRSRLWIPTASTYINRINDY